jgi:hypothetical protein
MTHQPYLHKPDELMQVARSSAATVRNPMLAVPGVREAAASVPAEARAALYAILMALRADCQAKAAESWRKHKAPMALYWKCVAVYAGHIAKLFR